MAENGYVWGGVLLGLAVIAFLGVLLFQRGRSFQTALAPYIGEQPARWALYAVWFAYIYSALNAVGGVVTTVAAFDPTAEHPTVVSFAYGAVFESLLRFLNALVPVSHMIALIVAAFVLYRHLRARPA